MDVIEGEITQNRTVSKNLSVLDSTMDGFIFFKESLRKRRYRSQLLNSGMDDYTFLKRPYGRDVIVARSLIIRWLVV